MASSLRLPSNDSSLSILNPYALFRYFLTPEEKAAIDVKAANYRIYKPWTWAMRWGGWKGVPDSTIGAEVNPRVMKLTAGNRLTTCMVVPVTEFKNIGAVESDDMNPLKALEAVAESAVEGAREGSIPPVSGEGSVDNLLLTTALGCEYSEGSREVVGLNVSKVENKHLNVAKGWHMVSYAIKIAESGNCRGQWDYESALLEGNVYGALDRADVDKADKVFNKILEAFHSESERCYKYCRGRHPH